MGRSIFAARLLAVVASLAGFHNRKLWVWVLPVCLFLVGFLSFFQYNPLSRIVEGDAGISLYYSKTIAQHLARRIGLPKTRPAATSTQSPQPHKFYIPPTITFVFGGVAMLVGSRFGIAELVSIRLLSMLLGALAVVATYFVARGFSRVNLIAVTAALILVTFRGYGLFVTEAIEPKSAMLPFALFALVTLRHRKWFWTGVLSAIAALHWLVSAEVIVVALLLAFLQTGPRLQDRVKNAALVLLGASLVLGGFALWFVTSGAPPNVLLQNLLQPFMVGRGKAISEIADRILHMLDRFDAGYHAQIPFGILGLFGLALLLLSSLKRSRTFASKLFHNSRTSGLLLTALGFLLFSFMDFQGYADWTPLLPYIAIFAALAFWQLSKWSMRCMDHLKTIHGRTRYRLVAPLLLIALLFGGAQGTLADSSNSSLAAITWHTEATLARRLNSALGHQGLVVAFGKPELLYFMRRSDSTGVIALLDRTDRQFDRFSKDGFRGFIAGLANKRPQLVILARVEARKFANVKNYFALMDWVNRDYIQLTKCAAAGSGEFYIRRDLARRLFQVKRHNDNCF